MDRTRSIRSTRRRIAGPFRFSQVEIKNGVLTLVDLNCEDSYSSPSTGYLGVLKATFNSQLMRAAGGLVIRIRDGLYKDLIICPVPLQGMVYYPIAGDSLTTGQWVIYHHGTRVRLDTQSVSNETAKQFASQWHSAIPANTNIVLNPVHLGDVDIHLDNTNRRVGFLFVL